jgi:hypothetical protein
MAETDIVIANNGPADIPYSKSTTGSQYNFIENPLSPFAQVAYHITLYAIGDTATYSSEDDGKIIIAESGVTGYNIKDLIIDGLVTPNEKSRGTVSTKITMTITEPAGTSFLDSMYDAVLAVGGSNWQKSVYRLEVRFKAYDEQGNIIHWLDSSNGMPKDGKWTWKIMIGDVETNLDASGATYRITARPIEETVPWDAPSSTTLKATTIGEFFTALKDHLNGADQKKTNTSPLDEPTIIYDINVHSLADGTDPKSWSVLGKWQNPDFHPIFHKGFKTDDRDKGVFNLTRGEKLPDIVDAIFAVSEEAQARIKNSQKPIVDPNDHGDGNYRDALVFRIYAETEITGYDYVNQNLKMKVTYHIKPFQAQNNWLLSNETTKPGNGQAALNIVNGYEGLKKRYEYLYTGLNTEVIHLDLKFNFQFSASMPRGNGDNYYSDNVVWHARMPSDPKAEADKRKQKQDDENAQKDRDNRENLIRIKNGLEMPDLTAEETQALTNEYRTIATALQAEYENEARARRAQYAGIRYAEDITDRATNTAIVSTGQSSGEGARQANLKGHTGQRHRAKSVYGALLDQLYAPTKELTLKIKGDPFWLGDYQTVMVNGNQDKQLVDWSRGHVGFVLYFRYPKGMTDEGVPIIWEDSQVFNTVYLPWYVQHSFANGAFTQTLRARRLRAVTREDVAPLASVQPTDSPFPGY